MESFVVSARKYRPSTFETVVGQHTLTQTLKNAIKSNHLAHAYLFCGPRGVGKTTCARIFAKTINCQHLTDDFEPCNECESCKAFNEQRSYNIHELDAASNNSVDDIRSLIEQVRIPPQIGKYSVYIVDEVHMLSQGAFNAFLKTLEEPPAHAIFILATTEKHKILPTILSRCQIYDFNRITIPDTVDYLQKIAQKEQINIDVEALNVIAQKSDGGMRDALSIFDQLVNFCGTSISYQDAISTLNVLDYEYYFRLVDCALASDVSGVLLLFNEVLAKGFEGQHFVDGLGSHLRDVMVSKDVATIALLEKGENVAKRYAEQAAKTPLPFLYKALQMVGDVSLNYRLSRNKRLAVEILLIKLCQIMGPVEVEPLQQKPIAPISSSPQKSPQKTAGGNEGVDKETATSPQRAQVERSIDSASAPEKAPEAVSQVKKNVRQAPATSPQTFHRSISINVGNYVGQAETAVGNIHNSASREKRHKPFDEEQLRKAWAASIDEVAEADDRLKSIMYRREPVMVAADTAEIVLENNSQESDMKTIETKLVQFIRDQIENDDFTLRFRIAESQEKAPVAYTSEDKMKLFVQKNSAVGLLKESFKLQLE